jgi:hypothetical protein
MARAHGARSQMALAFEGTYGTAPGSGFIRMPFASSTLGAEQPLIDSELLGYGRDPLPPIKDALSADGDVVIPIDYEGFGHWLKLAFGAPTTTGSAPNYTHTFQSGSFALPSASIEIGLPEVPRFAMYSGTRLNELSFTMQRSGQLQATARLIAQGETKAGTTQAGSPSTFTVNRFGTFQGAIKRDSVALGNIVSAEVTYSNGLDRIETIRADGKVDGVDPGMASLRGRLTARFADETLVDQAIAGTPCALEFSHTLNTNTNWVMTAYAVYLPRPRISVPGPQGIEVSFEWQAAQATSPARLVDVVLKNQKASYA